MYVQDTAHCRAGLVPDMVRVRGAREAAVYLRERHGIIYSPRTLDKLRSVGGGPVFERLHRCIYYPNCGLDAWAAEHLSRPMHRASKMVA